MQEPQIKKIAFIACSKNKQLSICPARHLYQGELFKKALKYCSLHFDEVFILSAKYGLVHPDDRIKYYDLTLNRMKKDRRREWSKKVKRQLNKRKVKGKFYFFTGAKYHEFFEGIKPLQGLGLGMQLKWFKDRLTEKGLGLK